MAYDPTLPANNSQISSSELRNQLKGLHDITNETADGLDQEITNQIAGTAINPLTVTTLTQTISNPPTQAQVQAIQDKLNELITAVLRPD